MSELETDIDPATDSERTSDIDFVASESEFIKPRMPKREQGRLKPTVKRTRSSTKSPPKKKVHQSAPPSTAAPTADTPASPFFTPNPFSSLTPTDKEMEQVKSKEFKPPPIYVRNIANLLQLCRILEEKVGKNTFTCKSRVDVTIFNFDTPASYRSAVHVLEEMNALFHTYQLKEDKAFRVVLRGLHPSTPDSVIMTELQAKGFSVRNVSNVKQRATKIPLPLFFLELNPGPQNKEIFNIQYIAYCRISVEEPYARKELVQCTRCQQYSHTRKYCHYEPRCVKCSGAHAPQDCPHPRAQPCICALCGSAHPANYRGCVKYKELIDKRRNPRVQPKSTQPKPSYNAQTSCSSEFPVLQQGSSTPPESQPVTIPPRSFANVLRGERPVINPVPPPSSASDLSALFSTFTNILSQLKNVLSPFLPLLQTLIASLVPAANTP